MIAMTTSSSTSVKPRRDHTSPCLLAMPITLRYLTLARRTSAPVNYPR